MFIWILYTHFLGQQVTILIPVINSTGTPTDAPSLPSINYIYLPDVSSATGYPIDASQMDTGLYYFKFTLPKGATAVGSYVVNYSYIDPDSLNTINGFVHVVCQAPFGLYSVSAG